MARIALIADIHGNAVALQHVLEEIERQGIDRIVCLGDVAATGPQPRQVVNELRDRDIPSIMGNADAEILEPSDPDEAEGDMVKILEIASWGSRQLEDEDRAYIAAQPGTRTVELDGEDMILCVHGSPRSFDEMIRADSPSGDLDQMLAGVRLPVVAAAHTHFPFLRRHRDLLVINPGAVGLAYDPAPPAGDIGYAGWAEFAILEHDDGRLGCSFQRVPYDVAGIHAAARASGMPHAEWWISLWRRKKGVEQ